MSDKTFSRCLLAASIFGAVIATYNNWPSALMMAMVYLTMQFRKDFV